MGEKQFSDALSKIPYAVSVVTVGVGGVENGLTISWLSQVSGDPAVIMFSTSQSHYSTDILKSEASFVVNLLASDQKDVAAHFAKQSMLGEDKIDKFPTRPAKSDVPILTDALAYFDCSVIDTLEAGNHLIVVGRIDDAGVLKDGQTLSSDSSGMRYRG